MKNKKLLLSLMILFASATISKAQLSGADAYMKGNYVEIGISGLGGFEGAPCDSTTVPFGMHYRSNNPYFGFVANPQMDSWTNFDGDFFTPGSPENGWGYEIGDTGSVATGTKAGNNCASLQQVNGAITSWSYAAGQTTCDWEGDATSGTNIHFKINYQLQDNDLFYITTVFVTNNTSSPITDFYYDRNLDPDNNIMLSSDYTTQNTILSQISAGGSNTSVSATQSLPWSSYFEFVAVDSNWVAGFGGFTNRDASDMYNGVGFTQAVGATNFADEAIHLSYKIPVLNPGGTQSFKFCTVFNASASASAATALSLSTVSTNDITSLENALSVYPNPFSDNTTISINKSIQLKNAEMVVYNVIGKEMARISDIQSHEFKLEKNNLSTGMYLYKLINNGQEIATGKLIIK